MDGAALAPLEAGRNTADHHIEHRRQEQAEHGHPQHAGKDRNAHRLAHLGARTGRQYQRHDTGDEGQRRHHNGTQPQSTRFHHRIHGGPSLCLECPGELDDQNRVLGRQPHQDDQADLHEHVVVAPHQPDPADRAEQTHGHDQQHRQRQQPAVVLRGKDKVGEQHTQREDVQRRVAGQLLLVGQLGPLKAHALGQHFLGQAFHHRHDLPRADPGWRAAGDVGGGIAVVVDDTVRTGARGDRHE
ncbi:hypothetical protein D3C72_1494510 [compost metagenome]